jgi:hypothetical protein
MRMSGPHKKPATNSHFTTQESLSQQEIVVERGEGERGDGSIVHKVNGGTVPPFTSLVIFIPNKYQAACGKRGAGLSPVE